MSLVQKCESIIYLVSLTYIYISMSCFHIKWLKSLVSLPWIEFKWNARICFFTLKPALDAWGFPDSTTSFVAIPSGCQDVEQVFENGKYALGDAGKQVFFFSFFFFLSFCCVCFLGFWTKFCKVLDDYRKDTFSLAFIQSSCLEKTHTPYFPSMLTQFPYW